MRSDAQPDILDLDQRVYLSMSASEVERLLELRGDAPRPRFYFLDSTVELISPSPSHEQIREFLGRLLEVWADENEVALVSSGSATLRGPTAGAEPDKSYRVDEAKPVPDLVIEVTWTHGGLDRREVYRALGVKELWEWKDEELTVLVLNRGRWSSRKASALFPRLDLGVLRKFVARWPSATALREYRSLVRKH